jgi:hypothetical protein
VPHRCSFDQISIGATMVRRVLQSATHLPNAGTASVRTAGHISVVSVPFALASACSVRSSCGSPPQPARRSVRALSRTALCHAPSGTSRCLDSLRAHCVGIDVGRQDLSILPGANQITTLLAP